MKLRSEVDIVEFREGMKGKAKWMIREGIWLLDGEVHLDYDERDN
jgi:hypothetical protein